MSTLCALSRESQLQSAWLLTAIIAVGLVGIGILVGMSILRHQHWERMKKETKRQHDHPPVDPWEEAGRRMEVPKEDDE